MRTARILSIGTELTLGQTVDTNGAWLAQRLAECGLRCERHVTVPDEREHILAALAQNSGVCDVLVITGGLGPTDDDLTREALAEAAGDELVLDETSVGEIAAFFAARGREMPERNRVQARRPGSATAIPNACGTAPGIRMTLGETACFALPGVPFEMKAMFEAAVAPAVRIAGEVLRFRRLHCLGLGESDVGERIRDLMQRGRNPEVGTTAALGIIGVRINAAGASLEEADRLLDATEAEVRSRLGAYVFGRDEETLATAVGVALTGAGATVAIAESCTGGLIAKELTDVPGSSSYVAGGIVAYANAAKERLLGVPAAVLSKHGAVSDAVAGAMAEGVRSRFGVSYGLSVTGVAGPGGGTSEKPVGLVYIGLSDARGTEVRECRFGDSPREVIRARTAHVALAWLRRRALQGPTS